MDHGVLSYCWLRCMYCRIFHSRSCHFVVTAAENFDPFSKLASPLAKFCYADVIFCDSFCLFDFKMLPQFGPIKLGLYKMQSRSNTA